MMTRRGSAGLEESTRMSMGRIVSAWWPLALSWLLMAAEGPTLSAVAARLPNPEVNLAAFGGVVYPLALIIEAPIIMLLSASTALSKDWDSYRKLRRFTMVMGAILTGVHVLVAFTPLYDVVVVQLIGPPAAIVEPARLGLMIMVPWSWAIGYRRFKQGVLIRFGHSRAVGLGTLVRLSADGLVLAAGYLIGTIPGTAVAASALAVGVLSEAIFAGLRARSVIQSQLMEAPPVEDRLTLRGFIDFYTPLAMTSLLRLLAEPFSSAALSRMPRALDSLAVWSIVSGFIFLLRSFGMAYSEVVIALLDELRSSHNLRRFMMILTVVVTALLLIVAATPLSMVWFERVTGLRTELAVFSRRALWVALLMPGVNVLQSWYQGLLVYSRRTRAVTEAVAVYLVVSSALLLGGVLWNGLAGLYVALAAIGTGRLIQTVWLWLRSRPVMESVEERDENAARLQAADICAR
ncbi:MAG: hypothetical protein PVJ55_09995 [Anaerolineae bacterium]